MYRILAFIPEKFRSSILASRTIGFYPLPMFLILKLIFYPLWHCKTRFFLRDLFRTSGTEDV